MQLEAADTVVGITAQAPQLDTVVAPPSSFSGAVGVAMSELGKPYVWAAAGPDSFDCSGLVVYSFAAVGKSLPHSTYALYSMGAPVSRDQLEPGDLVFFDGLGHVGIYIGGGQFVHAPHTGDVVKVSNLDEGWYASSYVGARRISLVGVERFDVLGEVLEDHLAADLQRRCQLVVLEREVARQDAEPLDLLVARAARRSPHRRPGRRRLRARRTATSGSSVIRTPR